MSSTPTETAKAPSSKSRRPHKKSRTGCSECRRRRVKCSEEKPRCRCCVRHDSECQYPVPAPLPAPAPPPAASTSYLTPRSEVASIEASQGEPAEEQAALPSPYHFSPSGLPETCGNLPEYTADDMALLHHWTISTSRCLIESPGLDKYWQDMFPRIAFRHRFLMHGILSLAALHLAHLEAGDKTRHMSDASRRHNQALQGFRLAIENMTDDNCDAIFACATVNIVYVFGMYGCLSEGHVGDVSHSARIARILGTEWIPIIRGIEAVLGPVYDRMRTGPLSPLLNLPNWEELDPDTVTVAGDEHFQRIRALWADNTDCEIYDQSLYLLRKCHAYMQQFGSLDDASVGANSYNRAWSGPLMWLYFVPEDFVLRLRQRQPPALVLFSHLAILLSVLDDLWVFRGWARNIVGVVDEVLGDYWERWIRWPKEVVGLAPCTG